MIRYHASWVLPIGDPPIRDGWVAVDRDRVVALGKRAPADTTTECDLGSVAILPGLVNAHTHLELSYLRDEVPPASEFVTWIRSVIGARRSRPDPDAAEIVQSVECGIEESIRSGTALVGDISNTPGDIRAARAQSARRPRLLRADSLRSNRRRPVRRSGLS